MSDIGAYGYLGEGLTIEGQNKDVSNIFTESDNTLFYSKDHAVYRQGEEGGWDFTTPVWYEYTDNYPQFVVQEIEEPEEPVVSRHHSRVIGSISGSIKQSQPEKQTPVITSQSTTQTQTPSITLGSIRILKLNMTGLDVKELQVWLNNHGYQISLTGPGSKGNETNFFGSKTKQAVIAFQKVSGLTPDGVVGPLTIKKMNEIK